MFWWKGRGLWICFLVGLPVYFLSPRGNRYSALAYLLSAGAIFMMKDWLGEESSLFSIPVRFWPPILLVISVVSYRGI